MLFFIVKYNLLNDDQDSTHCSKLPTIEYINKNSSGIKSLLHVNSR